MPYNNKKDPNSWSNSLPVTDASGGRISGKNNYQKLKEIKNFDADKLDVNQVEISDNVILAKIPKGPQAEHRIFRRAPETPGSETYIEFIADRWYDEEKHQSRNEKVIIGTECFEFPGMMWIRDAYYDYFNIHGTLYNDPLARRKAKEKEKQKAEEADKKQQPEEPKREEKHEAIIPQEEKKKEPSERTMDEIREDLLKKEQLLEQQMKEAEKEKERLQELRQEAEQALEKVRKSQKELDRIRMVRLVQLQEAEKDHIRFLDHILYHYEETIGEQAKRRPNAAMSLHQIRTINELLYELREFFMNSTAERYLKLAEEPDPENDKEGTTYGEMTLILAAYKYSIDEYISGRLQEKEE